MADEGADQVAAVCYRWREGQPEFLLVRTSDQQCWVFPKGEIDMGEADWEAAEREAEEEAGASGSIHHIAFAIFRYVKRDWIGWNQELSIAAFLLHVKREFPPLENYREPTWFTPDEAEDALVEGRDPENAQELRRTLRLACAILDGTR